jgi:mRNA deadenylase 3'-5' endonuclease subunit Ccr4
VNEDLKCVFLIPTIFLTQQQQQKPTKLISKDEWTRTIRDKEQTDVSLVSWNLLRKKYRFNDNTWASEANKDWLHRQHQLERNILEFGDDMDFLCFQEVEEPEIDLPFLDAKFGLVSAVEKGPGAHTFTKPRLYYRKERWNLLWFESRSRVVIGAFVPIESPNAAPLIVMNVHLTGGPSDQSAKEREQQIASAFRNYRKETKTVARDSLIVCGDFNSTTRFSSLEENAGLYHVLGAHNIQFATHQWSHEGNSPFYSTIDHVYASPNLELQCVREPFTDAENREVVNAILSYQFSFYH